jgi:hypothetical protein
MLLNVEYLASMLEDAIVQMTRRETGFGDKWQESRVRAVMLD